MQDITPPLRIMFECSVTSVKMISFDIGATLSYDALARKKSQRP